VGHPVSSFYGFKVVGIFKDVDEVAKAPQQQSAAPGRFRYLDADGDGTITSDDRVFFGNANPKFTAGINVGLTFKDFDFTAFFYGSFGNDVINLPKYWSDLFQTAPPFILFPAKSRAALYASWTPQNTNTTIPIQEIDNNFSTTGAIHSFAMEDGSYLRSKSITLGYTLRRAWLQNLGVGKMRAYLQAVNLFTLTNYTGLDPELSGQSAAFGIDYGNYPNQQQFVVGFSVNF
jgi:hypothetical protein